MLAGKALAIDGKTLRGSRDAEQPAVHLLSAVIHKEGIVVAQQRVDKKTNEITQVQPLLDQINLEGAVVTADALLTQRHIAEYLVTQKNADYVFTVKGNQPTPGLRQSHAHTSCRSNSSRPERKKESKKLAVLYKTAKIAGCFSGSACGSDFAVALYGQQSR